MPRQRRETNKEWLNRLREARGLPPLDEQRLADTLVLRTRAAVTYVNTTRLGRDDPSAIAAFMHIFHPDADTELTQELIRDARNRAMR